MLVILNYSCICSCGMAANVGHYVLPDGQVALPYMAVKSSCFCPNDLPTRQEWPTS